MGYAVTSLVFAALFAGSAWVLGLALLNVLGARGARDGPPAALLAIPAGTGVLAMLAFVLAAAGILKPIWTLVSTALAVALAAYAILTRDGHQAARWRAATSGPWLLAAGGLLGVAAVLLALSAPLEWDELAYHLPYARDYAEAGSLVVSENLRFPLQPHNFQLLYATALQLAHEPAAHLLHALSGAMVAVGLFVFTRHHFGGPSAIIAVVMWVSFSGSLMDTAYVDLGVALFVFFAFYSFTLWQQSRENGFLLLAAFLLAMAAGTKYQALVQLPAFVLALVVAARRDWLRPAARAGVVFLLTGSWWYVRNWLISGDPVHPLGAEWFGYWLWDQGDLAGQVADIARVRGHVPFELVPALGFLLLRRARNPAATSLLIVGLTGLAAWYLSSGYDRYLLPTYPFLAILSAATLVAVGRRLLRRFKGPGAPSADGRAARNLGPAGFAVVALALAWTVGSKWDEICFTEACVAQVQGREFASPAVADAIPRIRQLRLYQLGLENELYLMGDDTAGDWFGPYRYREVLDLADNAGALRGHLLRLGRDSLLVHRERAPFNEFSQAFEPGEAFEKAYEDAQVTLYLIAAD